MLIEIALSFASGLLVGAAYFAGLWFTVRRLTGAGLAPVWLFASAIVRLALLIAALFWIVDDSWERLLAALAGIIAARWIAMRSVRVAKANGPIRPQTTGAADADHTR